MSCIINAAHAKRHRTLGPSFALGLYMKLPTNLRERSSLRVVRRHARLKRRDESAANARQSYAAAPSCSGRSMPGVPSIIDAPIDRGPEYPPLKYPAVANPRTIPPRPVAFSVDTRNISVSFCRRRAISRRTLPKLHATGRRRDGVGEGRDRPQITRRRRRARHAARFLLTADRRGSAVLL